MSKTVTLLGRGAAAGTLVAAAVVGACVLPGTSAMAQRASASTSTQQAVVLALRPQRPNLLAHAAVVRFARLGTRRTAVGDAVADPARNARVREWLVANGFTVTDSGPLTVSATAPAARVRRAFANGTVPAALGDDVRSVVTAADGHRWRPLGLPGGTLPATLTGAYAGPVGALGAGATIATVQFSGWPALADPAHSDLANWAAAAGSTLPSITAIGVNGADPGAADGSGGDREVALDQEALLAVAPQAAQRVYVTTNGDAVGSVAVWDRILADVRSGVHITAVSTSWGACEPSFSQREINAIEQDLTALSGLGVGVFAASGDSSAYDCGGTQLSVDFPASSPAVVGVGGTDLTTGTSSYDETAWGGTAVDGQQGAGSGGGVSKLFNRPTWQQSVANGLPASRLVPDISSEAAPQHGLAVLVGGQWMLAGGTSLAAPTQAGLYAATLAAAGHAAGSPVEPHAALYGAPPAAFRDITAGTNHAYAAAPGYDAVTGLGTPQWSALSSPLTGVTSSTPVSTTAPAPVGVGPAPVSTTAPAPVSVEPTAGPTTSPAPVSVEPTAGPTTTAPPAAPRPPVAFAFASLHGHRLTLRWSGLLGQASYRVALKVRRDGHVRVAWSRHYMQAAHLQVLALSGRAYQLVVTAFDDAGNRSAPAATRWLGS